MRPAYAPEHPILVAGDLVTFEVEYDDGTMLLQRNFPNSLDAYGMIDRDRLCAFKLVAPGELLLEMKPPPGATGRNLIYRRRTEADSNGRRRVIFLIGWAPMGPVVMIDPAAGKLREAPAFLVDDPDMYPPEPIPADGRFLLDSFAIGE